MLHLDLKINETIQIGDVLITLIKKTGQLARLSIDASKDIDIKRLPAKCCTKATNHVI